MNPRHGLVQVPGEGLGTEEVGEGKGTEQAFDEPLAGFLGGVHPLARQGGCTQVITIRLGSVILVVLSPAPASITGCLLGSSRRPSVCAPTRRDRHG